MRKMQQLRELCCFGLFLVGLAALGHGWLGLGLGSDSGSGCTNWLCLHSTRMKICVANKVEPDGKLICFTTMDQPASKPVSQPAGARHALQA